MRKWTANGLWLLLTLAPAGAGAADGKAVQVRHEPREPHSDQPVHLTVLAADARGLGLLVAQYQVVEPGNYIARADAAYAKEWRSVPMSAGGQPGEFKVELPGTLQKHRRLIRYRILSDDHVIAPAPADAEPNFAYYVYDGVPSWRAAIDPHSAEPTLRAPVSFDARLMGSVQVYQFLAAKEAVENTTWYRPANRGEEQERHGYKYTGTLVVHGEVYDHIRFRARGGEWRHAMGKNMWKFDFLRGHHLRAQDDFGRAYQTKWEKLNLGACIQQGNYHRRGEHGLFEAVTFALFNLADVPAPRTHYVHLRIIDQPEENPGQYEGDFWGLYLATEEIDSRFLEEHHLPDGNIYKWDFGEPKPAHIAPGAPTNRADVLQFISRSQRQPADDWWRENVDLPRYFSYRSILECVHHYDIAAGKNYFYYFHPRGPQCLVLPWDVDLTWKNNMYGSGQEPFWRAGVLRRPAFEIQYKNRLREIRDLLFQPEQTGALIDQCAAVIADPAGGPSFVDADRAKWDYHPIMSSRWVHPMKAGTGQYYLEAPGQNFRGMIQLMKDYVVSRGRWCDAALLNDGPLPPTGRLEAEGSLDVAQPDLRFHATLGPEAASVKTWQWRLAEVSVLPISQPPTPRAYEIQALWEETGPDRITIPNVHLEAGLTYRVRARACDETGRCGHWSEPIQFRQRADSK